jgi:hypothetical protein
MLRLIVTSLAQALAIVLFAECCWLLLAYFVENDPWDLAPLFIAVLYPLPSAVAALRKHNALLDIMVTNFWLGWTIIGWFASLMWACNWNVEALAE